MRIFDHPKSRCFLQLMKNLSMSPCFFFWWFSCKGIINPPPLFRQLKNNQNTNNAHCLQISKILPTIPFFGRETQAKKSNFLASWVFKKSCRSKLMVRIRAVAHELQSCSTSSFRSGEVANPAIRGAKAKGDQPKMTGFFRGVGGAFLLKKTFF